MKIKMVATSATLTVVLILVGVYTYPKLIVRLHESEWPTTWNAELYKLNYQQIVEKIGPPSEDASAKEYQSWLKRESWGVFQLKIGFKKCCDDKSQPNNIYRIIRLNSRYEPAQHVRLPSPGEGSQEKPRLDDQ